jgi:hypothetical protein
MSVEGLHASETLNGVTAVTRKFLGVVGLILSPQANADETNTNANSSLVKLAFTRKCLSKQGLD